MGINVVFVGKVESKIGKFTVDPTIFTMVNLKLTVFRFFMFSVLAELQTLILDRPEEGRGRQSPRKQSYNAIWKSYILDYQHNFPIFC